MFDQWPGEVDVEVGHQLSTRSNVSRRARWVSLRWVRRRNMGWAIAPKSLFRMEESNLNQGNPGCWIMLSIHNEKEQKLWFRFEVGLGWILKIHFTLFSSWQLTLESYGSGNETTNLSRMWEVRYQQWHTLFLFWGFHRLQIENMSSRRYSGGGGCKSTCSLNHLNPVLRDDPICFESYFSTG